MSDEIYKKQQAWLTSANNVGTVTTRVGGGQGGGDGGNNKNNNIFQTCRSGTYITELYITGGNVVKNIGAKCSADVLPLTLLGNVYTDENPTIIQCDKGLSPNAVIEGDVVEALNFRCFNKDKAPIDISVGDGDSGGKLQWYGGNSAKPDDITPYLAGCPLGSVINGYGGEFGDKAVGKIQFSCIKP